MSISVKIENGLIAGHLGEILFNQYIKLGWIRKMPGKDQYSLTPKGERELSRLGIAASQIPLEDAVIEVPYTYTPRKVGV